MRTLDVAQLAAEQGGEYVLGMKDLHSHACYFIYGILKAGESARLVRPGEGHEEILCAVDGPLTMQTDRGDIVLPKGHAVHVKETASFTIANPSDRATIYVLAGGQTRSAVGRAFRSPSSGTP